MNFKLLAFSLALGLASTAQANYSLLFNPGNVAVPDNDPNGYQDLRTVAGLPGVIADVNVTLNISGGFNSDLYVWLSHGSGLTILLNRVGISSANTTGYANGGVGQDAYQNRFTLDDQAAQDVHFYQAVPFILNGNGQVTGNWQSDGRILDPDSSPGLFDAAARSNNLGVFDGLNPNGQWTLFVADQSSGDISTLTEWGLEIAVVPEPSVCSLIVLFVALFALLRRSLAQRGTGMFAVHRGATGGMKPSFPCCF
jgi:subtilisin-like proprotein convertase family protein